MENDDIDSLYEETKPTGRQLNPSGIKTWLKQYKVSTRSSTVTNAFVAALLPHDDYDEKEVKDAMTELGQTSDKLVCVYCGEKATTWDHLTCLVKGQKANGPGHRIRNLVPCCGDCNSSKRGTPFGDWILGYSHPKTGKQVEGAKLPSTLQRHQLVAKLEKYQAKSTSRSLADSDLEIQLMTLRDSVLDILKRADKLVAEVRGSAAVVPRKRPEKKVKAGVPSGTKSTKLTSNKKT